MERTLASIALVLEASCEKQIPFNRVRISSLEIEAGDVFFALPGQKTDGHFFLREAATKQAAGAIISTAYTGPTFGLNVLRVKDVLEALHRLATYFLLEKNQKIIALTGSVGKTTTKEFISHFLSSSFKVGKTPFNANSQISFPMSILNLEGKEEVLVLEMGMTKRGEIEKLVKIAPPDLALITHIGHAHIGDFHTLDKIAEVKSEIFSNPNTKIGFFQKRASQYKAFDSVETKVTYSCHETADYSFLREHQQLAILERGDRSPFFTPPFQEKHFLENLLGSFAIARYLGLTWDCIFSSLPTLQHVQKRFEKIEHQGILFINDAYNASLEAIYAAFENLPSVTGKKFLVFGSMVDLGDFIKEFHQKVAFSSLKYFDEIFCLGKDCLCMEEVFKKEEKPFFFFEAKEDLETMLFSRINKGDLVLIKGAKIHELWTLVERL